MRQPTRLIALGLAFYSICTLFSMAAMSTGAVVLVCAIGIGSGGVKTFLTEHLKPELREPSSRQYLFISLWLAAACALSLIVGKIFPLSFNGIPVEIHFLKDLLKSWYLFWPLILAAALRSLSLEERERVLKAWLIAFALLSALGVLQYFIGWPRPHMIPGNEPRFHSVLFLGHHLSVASIYIFPLFAALSFIFKQDSVIGSIFILPRWFLVIASILGCLTLAATFSRALWIALPIGLLLFVCLSLPKKWASITTAAIVLAMIGIAQVPSVSNRFGTSLGTESRKNLWAANIEFFKARPLTGTGWHHNLELSGYYFKEKGITSPDHREGEVFSGHAHNNIIEMLGSTGLIGLFCWLLWCGFVIFILWRAKRINGHWPGFAGGLVCAWLVFHLNGLTQVNFWESKVLHQMALMVAWSLVWVRKS